MFERYLAEEGIGFSAILERNSIHAINQCVMEGIGISIMPEIAVREEITKGKLATLKWDENPLEAAVLIIWHEEKWISPALKSFMDMVEKLVNNHR
jgi:DNA-binding transcriptional LysR family regulator